MLIDARSLADKAVIEADLCIVGSGPAGMTIAKRLAESGIRIAVLESGGRDVEPEINRLTEGELTGLQIEALETTRVRALGGTSTVWNGQCRMLDVNDFEHRPWIPHSGWPFPRKELESHYAIAHRILRLQPVEYDLSKWATRTGQRFLEPSHDIFFNRVSLTRPVHFWTDYGADLEKAEDVGIYTHATVLGIRLAADGQSVDRLDVGTLDGKRLTARARRYVLACGGIENARLLLLSDDVHPNGVGNGNDLVGRFFMEHPRFVSGVLVLSGKGLPQKGLYGDYYIGDGFAIRGDLGIRAEVQEREGIGNVLGRLDPANEDEFGPGAMAARHMLKQLRQGRVPDDLMANLWTVISEADDVVATAYRRLIRDRDRPITTYEVESYIEQVPNPDSRVTLAEERDAFGQPRVHVDWRLSEIDKRTSYRAIELFAQAVGANDIGRIRVVVKPEDIFPPTTGWGHHHMGTTRMNDDPKSGVVDRNAKVHGIANLFVAGSSVFPTSGCATPTLTLVALAARLSEHLDKQFKEAST